MLIFVQSKFPKKGPNFLGNMSPCGQISYENGPGGGRLRGRGKLPGTPGCKHCQYFLCLETYHAKASADHQAIPANVNISGEEEQNPEEEDTAEMTAGDNNEKDLNPRDHVVLTASCKSISPCIAAVGTLTITTTALYFSLDEEHPDNLKLDPKVGLFSILFVVLKIYVIPLYRVYFEATLHLQF
jgi:hypothetical protein